MKFSHRRVARQQCMDRAPQVANAFAVNDSRTKDTPAAALNKILRDDVLYLLRAEGVQVQHTVDWQWYRFVVSVHQKTITCSLGGVEV